MKTQAQCLADYQDSATDRRRLAQRYLEGRLQESDFRHRWQWYDVKAEAIMIQRQREQARRKAAEERKRKEANERQKDLFKGAL